MPREIEQIFCPQCGALLMFDKFLKEKGQIFNVCPNGHKVLRGPSSNKRKGRAV